MLTLFNKETKPELTKLHKAARNGNYDKVVELLKTEDVYAKDQNGKSPLHLAAENGHENVVSAIIAFAPNTVKLIDIKYNIPLQYAAKKGHVDVVRTLLKADSFVNSQNKKDMTPLCYAAKYGHAAVAQELLASKATLGELNYQRLSAMQIAAQYGQIEVVRLLLQTHWAKYYVNFPNADGNTPLHFAARSGNVELVKLLIQHGATIDAMNEDGAGPIAWAARKEKGHKEVIVALVEAGVSANTILGGYKQTLLHWAATNDVELVEKLIKYGASVDTRDANDSTPLHLAAGENQTDAAIVLIRAGAAVTAMDWMGCTPLHWAITNSDIRLVAELIRAGALVNVKNNKDHTPLHWAAKRNGIDGVQLCSMLIQAGAILPVFNRNGNSPLWKAKKEGNIDVISYLFTLMNPQDIETSIKADHRIEQELREDLADYQTQVAQLKEKLAAEFIARGQDQSSKTTIHKMLMMKDLVPCWYQHKLEATLTEIALNLPVQIKQHLKHETEKAEEPTKRARVL